MGIPSEEQLQALAKRAEAVKKKRTEDSLPLVVELAGSPKAGKTTNIEIIEHFFKRVNFKIWAPTEGASKRTPYHLRRNLVAYNTWTLNYAISELLVAYYNVDRPDLIILDRGPFDSLAWMSLLRKKGDLSAEHLSVVKDFALLPQWSDFISRLFLFTCNPEISLERDLSSKLTSRPGIAMNQETLSDLLKEYQSLREELQDYPVRHIDTSETDGPLETAYGLADDIITLFEAQQNAS